MRKLKEKFIKPGEDVKFDDIQQDMIELIRSYKLRVNTNRKDKVFTISKTSENWRVEGYLEFAGLKYCLVIGFYLNGNFVLKSKYVGDSFEEFVDDLSDVVMFYNSTNYKKLKIGYEKLEKYIEDDGHYRKLPIDEIHKYVIEQKQSNDDLADVPDAACEVYANSLARRWSDTLRAENTNRL